MIKTDIKELAGELQKLVPILKKAVIFGATKALLLDNAPTLEIDTIPMEAKTALLNAASLLGPEPIQRESTIEKKATIDPTEMALLKTISMLTKLKEKTTHQEPNNDQEPKIKQIETILQNEAAEKVFKMPFQENNLESNFNESKEKQIAEFLKLFLHQGFIYPNINLLGKLSKKYIFLNPFKQINLINNDDGFFIQVDFFVDRIFDLAFESPLKSDKDFYVKGMAKYKVTIVPYNQEGWIAQVDLIDSSLESSDNFKDVLDKRNILEKIQAFLEIILAKLKVYLSSDNSLSNKPKFKSFFFASPDGESVLPKLISADNPDSGKVLNILLDGMTHK